jgi:exodeoxyribonuclease-5
VNWSPQQEAALKAVAAWIADKSGPQVFRLFGFAGTGKTTLMRHLAEGVDGLVLFGAFTGKAALVLRQKGCTGASTIHSMIYTSQEKSRLRLLELEGQLFNIEGSPAIGTGHKVARLKDEIAEERKRLGQPSFKLNPCSDAANAALIGLDEASQVNEPLGRDVLSFGKKVLVLGDPFQLPPVYGGGYFTDAKPDVMLTEIHRHALDSPVLALATRVRMGESIHTGWFSGESCVTDDISPEEVLACDQVIVGRNATRRASNRRMRQLLGKSYDIHATMPQVEHIYPVRGDKVVCLRNNHELGLLNGGLWTVDRVGSVDDDRVEMDVIGEDGATLNVTAHAHHFQGRELDLPWFERKDAEEFDYGYALTCHKAQGSQFNSVVLFDESACFRADARRWLYTGITRAVERVTVVRRGV